jgi:hypothetical protein
MAVNRLRLDPDRDPWERQQKEGTAQYARFTFFRDLGRLRTLTRVYKLLTETGDTLKYNSLRQYAYRYRWVERAEHWDIAQDAADHERLIIDHREMVAKHRRIAGVVITKALTALQKIPSDAILEPADIVRFLKFATDIERIALGAPQRTVAVTGAAGGPVQVEDIGALSPEQRRARFSEVLAEIAQRAGLDADDDDDGGSEDDD